MPRTLRTTRSITETTREGRELTYEDINTILMHLEAFGVTVTAIRTDAGGRLEFDFDGAIERFDARQLAHLGLEV